MAESKKFETHYLEDVALPGFSVPACIQRFSKDPKEVTCKRCLRRMGRYTTPRDARAGRVKRIVDGIMDAVHALLP